MSDLHVENWPVERLRPYAKNPRKNDAAVPRMVEALREFGFRIPILAKNDGEVIDGHLRLKAALDMGLESVPVIICDDMTPEQVRAFRILVNQSASWAEWDEDLLIAEIRALQADSFDIRFTGFDMGELEKFLEDAQTTQLLSGDTPEEEELPEPPANPVTRLGDIWQLGEHAIVCADSADADAVAALMDSGPASLCFTSPPYGGQRDYTHKIKDWDSLMQGVFRSLPVSPDAQVLVNLGLIHRDHEVQPYWNGWIECMRTSGWRFFGWYVWDQGFGLPGDWSGRLAPSHEFIFHFNKEARRPNKIVPCIYAGQTSHLRKDGTSSGIRDPDGKVGTWTHEGKPTQDYRIPDSIVHIGRQRGPIGKDIDHPAVFPIAFPEYIIATWAQTGDVVFEPFCGSGTTVIAGQRRGVKVRAVEIAPAYVDVALIRFSRLFPDIPITLRSSGESFAQVAASRQEAAHV
ncbi:MAG: ParB N-terminal domain-containing protein [Deltaproteobacteria bacterium]|nr:ParB N-terminal domain-containing protein [Deltaproteobacteria bacterium]